LGGLNWGSPKSYFSPYGNPYLSDGPPREHLPTRLAEETCRFIADHRQRPFFAYLSFYSVHIPLDAPGDLIEKYQAKAARRSPKHPAWGRERTSKVRLVQNHPVYAAMIEALDNAVGMVLDVLDQHGLADDTIVLFTSDNGGLSTKEGSPTSNAPLRAGKGWLYEGGIRVPAIVRWPGVVAPDSSCPEPINSNDYYPTFLAAVGKPPPPEPPIDGTDITPFLRGEQVEGRVLYWHYPHYGNQGGMPGSAVRDGRWKLIEWHEDGAVELYDLAADPDESNNVAAINRGVVDRLRKSLAAWRREVDAKSGTLSPRYKP
jgi:arylsulfatase A-like enzyme